MSGASPSGIPNEGRSPKADHLNGTGIAQENGDDAPCLNLKRVRLPVFSRARRNVKWAPLSAFWFPDIESARRACERKLQGDRRKRKASESFLETFHEYDKWVFYRSSVIETEENGLTDHSGAKVQRLEETNTQEQASSSSQIAAPPVATFSTVPASSAASPSPSPFVFGMQPSFGASNPAAGQEGSLKPFQFGLPPSNVPALPNNTFGSNPLAPFLQPSVDSNSNRLIGTAPSFPIGPMQPPVDGNQIFAFNPASFSNVPKRSTYSRRRRR